MTTTPVDPGDRVLQLLLYSHVSPSDSESLVFASVIQQGRQPLVHRGHLEVFAELKFCIAPKIVPDTKRIPCDIHF